MTVQNLRNDVCTHFELPYTMYTCFIAQRATDQQAELGIFKIEEYTRHDRPGAPSICHTRCSASGGTKNERISVETMFSSSKQLSEKYIILQD